MRIVFLFSLCLISGSTMGVEDGSPRLHEMSPESIRDVPSEGLGNGDVFCSKGLEPAFYYFWSSAVYKFRIEPSAKYTIYYGDNASTVLDSIRETKASWFYSISPWKSRDVKVHPFREACVGIISEVPFSVLLRYYRINYWQILMTALGLGGFLYAGKLSRNVFLHYATSITVGVLFSFLALTYFFQRRMGLSWGSWIIALYSISLYFLTSLLSQIKTYIMERHLLVLGYIASTALISAGLTYRFGPVSNPRTLNLIQWTLQGLSLGLIYLSSYYQSLSFTLCLLLTTYSVFPFSWLLSMYRRKAFKPNIRLLSESEYMDQSRVETDKALQDLRNYCNSPDCKPWKTMRTLTSPSRFAEFIDGASHLLPEEIVEYSHVSYDESGSFLGNSQHQEGGSFSNDEDDSDEIDMGEDL